MSLSFYFHSDDSICQRLYSQITDKGLYDRFSFINLKLDKPPDFLRGVPTLVQSIPNNVNIFEGTKAFEYVKSMKSNTNTRSIYNSKHRPSQIKQKETMENVTNSK